MVFQLGHCLAGLPNINQIFRKEKDMTGVSVHINRLTITYGSELSSSLKKMA